MSQTAENICPFHRVAGFSSFQVSFKIKANRASHGPRVRAKEGVKRTRENPKDSPKDPKVPRFTQGYNTGLSGLRNQRQAGQLRNLHRHVPLTLPGTMVGIVTHGTMAGVLMNGMMTGVLLDGTKVGNQRMTLRQAHFHLEVWILVPRVKEGAGDGRFYRTASGEWIPDTMKTDYSDL